ncbi:MAG: rhodanese-like domain-containing protein [Chloroflexota bacterium]
MSNKRSKTVRSSAALRGASRPIDPRRAPGKTARRGIDPFAIGLIATSTIGVLVVILFIALNSSGSSSGGGNALSALPGPTQTMIIFSTQTAPNILPRVTIAEAKALTDANDVKIVDVRDKQFYDQGHIKGSINVPHGDLASRLSDLPRSGNLVLYCECPNDEESASVAYALKIAGYTNMRILQGPQALTAWKNAGYPVEP